MTNHFPHTSQKSTQTFRKATFTTQPSFEDCGNEFASFIKKAYSYKNLSAVEEAEVCARIKAGDKDAKKVLVNANLKLVFTIAKKKYPYFKNPLC